jgi:hypothetical protein
MRRKSCFAGRLPDPKTASASPSSAPMTSSNQTNRFEGARRSKLAALQLLFVLHGNAGGHLGLQRARFEAFGVTGARAAKLVQDEVFGVAITGEILTYHLVFAAVAAAFLLLLRVVNLPSARVLKLSPRTRFASKRLATHRLPSHARYLHFNWRDARRGLVRPLVTLRRPGYGAFFFDPGRLRSQRHGLAQWRDCWRGCVSYSPTVPARRSGRDFLTRVRRAPAALPALSHPSRWLLWLRLVFVLAVYLAPSDIVGALKAEEE